MRPHLVCPRRRPVDRAIASAAVLALVAAAPLAPVHAQWRPRAERAVGGEPAAAITPYAGYMLFGRYLDGPIGTDVRGAAAPVGGAQLSLRLAPGVALVANGAYSSGDLEIGLPILGGLDVGSRTSWLYDAGLELRAPARGPSAISPFLQVGAGGITTRLGSLGVRTTSTSAAANVGAGLDLSLGGTLGARVMAKDYVSRFRSEEVAGARLRGEIGHTVALSAGLRLSF